MYVRVVGMHVTPSISLEMEYNQSFPHFHSPPSTSERKSPRLSSPRQTERAPESRGQQRSPHENRAEGRTLLEASAQARFGAAAQVTGSSPGIAQRSDPDTRANSKAGCDCHGKLITYATHGEATGVLFLWVEA
jgi:hypothetical protein